MNDHLTTEKRGTRCKKILKSGHRCKNRASGTLCPLHSRLFYRKFGYV